ncbi:adenylate kinase [Halorhabdus sp. CBA1104]|uniref:adenylate kinase family protein n=1 Tax=unclassified Halorhabdus TaxID=2621901 RepID=UPI0012B1BDD9|nr:MULTISPECIES: adenylate kinase family protein [unclassified Halorhabdus]QGN06865.1 adenylate kinase [Halorhabdus sp. CBA1104]
MRVAVTGTPGTGKTSATEHLESDFDVVHLNEVITQEGLSQGTDDERDSTIADLDAIREWFDGRDDDLVESHLAHHLSVDRVVVLRCHPETIEQRLDDRGESEASAQENAESEALDVILVEAIEEHGEESVYEIETTDRSPEAVATEIEAVLEGEREPGAGAVSYIDYL